MLELITNWRLMLPGRKGASYKMFLEDRSKGVHNAVYTIQILYDSLNALDPTLDNSRRPR